MSRLDQGWQPIAYLDLTLEESPTTHADVDLMLDADWESPSTMNVSSPALGGRLLIVTTLTAAVPLAMAVLIWGLSWQLAMQAATVMCLIFGLRPTLQCLADNGQIRGSKRRNS